MKQAPIATSLFLDIGGVLLTDGWDHHSRERAATHFKLDWAEMEDRHRLTFETHEEGKLTLEEYLGRVVFYQERAFTRVQFRHFMLVYIENTPMFVEIAEGLGIRSILHMDYRSTCAQLATLGLQNDAGTSHETG
jgi:putative hydrolase of the HAD superfamily